MGTLNFSPGQFLCCCCFSFCPSVVWLSACACMCGSIHIHFCLKCQNQKSVICYLYKTRRLLFQSTPLVSPSFSLLCEMSSFSITSPSSVSRCSGRSLSHNSHSPPVFPSSFGTFFFFFFLFRDSQTISLEIFHQIAEEYITPKPGCQKEPITMLLKISENISAARLLSPSENLSNLLWWWTPHRPFRIVSNTITASKLSAWWSESMGHSEDIETQTTKHKLLLDVRRNQSNVP